jgi:hypothetical protein
MPRIPNLELGFLWSVGNNVRAGRLSADYLLPFRLGSEAVVFGEVHAEFQDFWKTPPGGANNRVDLSFGGGYRRIIANSTLLGLNGFYDTSRLFGAWYSSGSLGLEMAAIIPGDGAIDLNVNWYGDVLSSNGLLNAFRNQGGSYDIEAGYSQPLFNQALDLRLKLSGYQFDIGTKVYGWRAGAELTTRDGVFSVKYEHGCDRVNSSYDTVGAFVNVGVQWENLIHGQSPFVMPEPVFQSPRNIQRLLTRNVFRNWFQSTAAIGARALSGCGTRPYFIVTFRDGRFGRGTVQLQTHGETSSTVVVTQTSGCEHFEGSGYEILIGGERPAGDITVNITGTPDTGSIPNPCWAAYDTLRGVSFAVTIPAGASSIDLPNDPSNEGGTPEVYYRARCLCGDGPVSAFAGTMTFSDPSGRIPTQTVSFYTAP